MNYTEKLERMEKHLAKHPHDYQTVISHMKVASKAYDHQRRQITVARLKNLAEIRKRLREEDLCRGTK